MDLVDKAALEHYANDPGHKEIISRDILPIVEENGILAMDYEF